EAACHDAVDRRQQDRRQDQELRSFDVRKGTRLRPRFFMPGRASGIKPTRLPRCCPNPGPAAPVEVPSNRCKVLFMNERPEDSDKAPEPESLLPIDEHVEEGQDAEGRKVRHRGIYLLPNLFTTAALFSGFYAIINGMSGHSDHAAIAIFVAMVLDGLDGRVARLTNTQSAFGAEYDSLSDMVAFGV